jgi:hypothetical protein
MKTFSYHIEYRKSKEKDTSLPLLSKENSGYIPSRKNFLISMENEKGDMIFTYQ